ncbi:MAG: RES family NAD+ phosphorylase, partial [Arenimonas sp.]
NDIANDPGQWVMAALRFPANALLRLDAPVETWKERPYRSEVRAFGDQWASEQESLALRVPSAVCPYEYNVLINTTHSGFQNVFVENLTPLEYDLRLTR